MLLKSYTSNWFLSQTKSFFRYNPFHECQIYYQARPAEANHRRLGWWTFLFLAIVLTWTLGYQLFYAGRIFPGVSVAGVDLSASLPMMPR
ncbi:hypothetical protein [Candidatus Villigracilis saccharophilus]|uniref:hypothetical protein n=1 Tax=Candidatus Villigracilis saccharophilus TaxID=3140684 RepID=UPI003136E0BB|nr:hypothetical protein [Anaerolineales bacterium]